MKPRILLPIALAFALGGGGCSTLESAGTSLIVSTSTPGPTQAKDVKSAILITTGIEEGLDLYVVSGSPSAATLDQITILVTALHNTLLKAEDAQRSGNSALVAGALAAFNESLAAVRAYKALKGIPQ